MICRRILVHGRVQGVFFRGWTEETARALHLCGWVRNLRSGQVEILAFGDTAAVEKLIERCREGPPAASVERVDVKEAATEPLSGFEQRPTL